MKETYLKVTKVEQPKTATDGRKYQQVWFTLITLLNGIQVKNNAPERSANFWEQGPPSAKGLTDFSKGDPLYGNLRIGEIVEGDIVTKTVEPYLIEGREEPVDQYTMIVFPHENVETKFRRAGHEIVNPETGEIARVSLGQRQAVKEMVEEEQY